MRIYLSSLDKGLESFDDNSKESGFEPMAQMKAKNT